MNGGAGGASGASGGAGGGGGEAIGTTACAGGAVAGTPGASGSSLVGGGGEPEAGGGGGGGYVGGGQGGGGAGDACGDRAGSGGGGGGSSFAAPGLSAEFTGGFRRSDGRVLIAYSNPIAASEHSYLTPPNQELAVPAASGLLSEASAPGGDPLTASAVGSAAHGALTVNGDGSFIYVPASGYAGGDSFTYRIADPSGSYATAEVTLTVAAPPSASISAPTGGGTYVVGQVVPTAFSCSEGLGGPGLASCNDSNGAKSKSGGAGRLDTSTAGPRAYTVTVVSVDGLERDTSIGYSVVPRPLPPDGPDDPPSGPGGPPPGIDLSLRLGVERKSLRELLRTGKLVVVANVNEAASVALVGSAELTVGSRRSVQTRFVTVFKRGTVNFVEPGEKKVTLGLSRKGRRTLGRLSAVRLAIAGSATDDAGGRVKRTFALSLR